MNQLLRSQTPQCPNVVFQQISYKHSIHLIQIFPYLLDCVPLNLEATLMYGRFYLNY